MRPIDPAELSALLDGELDASRAAEVRAALAGDAALRAQYEALAQADAQLRAFAASLELNPRIRLPPVDAAPQERPSALWRALPPLVITFAWLSGKLNGPGWLSMAASALAFLAILVSLGLLIHDSDYGADARPASKAH